MRQIFCTRIVCDDYFAPKLIYQDINFGSYNRQTTLLIDASSEDFDIYVLDASTFRIGDIIRINDATEIVGELVTIIDIYEGPGYYILSLATGLSHFYSYETAYVTAGSEFRWAQGNTALTGWLTGIFAEGGIGSWTKALEVRDGGATEIAGNITIQLDNTRLFHQWLSEQGLDLPGLILEVLEWDTIAGFVVRARMKIESIEWTTQIYTINAKTDKNKRIANICSSVTTGENSQDIPAIFGAIDKAKLVQINSEEINVDTDYLIEQGAIDTVLPANCIYFYVNTVIDSSHYIIKICNSFNLLDGALFNTIFNASYISPISGAQKGKFRNIYNASVNNSTIGFVNIELNSFFEAAIEVGAWVKVIYTNKQYQIDSFPCKGFIDAQDLITTSNLLLYDYNEKFIQIPSYFLDSTVFTDNNAAEIEPTFVKDSTDTVDSFIINPVVSPALCELTQPELASIWSITSYAPRSPGVYVYSYYTPTTYIPSTPTITGTINNAIDRDHDTKCNISLQVHTRHGGFSDYRVDLLFPVIFKLPAFPENLTNADSIHFLLDSALHVEFVSGHNGPVYVQPTFLIRRFCGGSSIACTVPGGYFNVDDDPPPETVLINDGLDQYYLTSSDTQNQYFFVNKTIGTGASFVTSGYNNFTFTSLQEKDDYDSYYEVLLYIYVMINTGTDGIGGATGVFNVSLDYNELGMIIKKEVDVGEELYTKFKGRIRSSDWDRGKDSEEILESPRDLLEHLCRLQAYPDTSKVPENGWGKNYADFPLIKIDGIGGFDDDPVEMQEIDNLKLARQIFSVDNSNIDQLKQELCREISCANFTDKDGKECILRLIKPFTEPAITISMLDITDRAKIEIKDINPNEIYCEPTIYYGKNYASDKWSGQIAVTNSSAPTYQTGYVTGCTTEIIAQQIWNLAHGLWLKCRQINNAPSELTDLKFTDGAIENGLAIAEKRLIDWLNWQGNIFITIPLHYNKVKDWELCTTFNISLPNVNDGIVSKCMVTKIIYEPNDPFECIVEAIVYIGE